MDVPLDSMNPCPGPASGIDTLTPLNEIVARHPLLLEVLHRFGLDACCGGALPLGTAARQQGLAPDAVRRALEEALAAREAGLR